MFYSLLQSLLLEEVTERMWPLVDPRVGPEQSEASYPHPCPCIRQEVSPEQQEAARSAERPIAA